MKTFTPLHGKRFLYNAALQTPLTTDTRLLRTLSFARIVPTESPPAPGKAPTFRYSINRLIRTAFL